MAKFLKRLSNHFKNGDKLSDSGCDEEENTVMIEAFEWYCPADGQHWKRLKDALPTLKELGVDKIWIPPACKAGSPESNGYDIYDLYDLGEFDQKGSVATKWGPKEDLLELSCAARSYGMGLVFDAVLNHKAAADYTQYVQAQRVDPNDRTKTLDKRHETEAWLGYNFDTRAGRYSQMKYNASHFNAFNYDNATQTDGIYKIANKCWAKDVDKGNGNYDYLLCNDVDLSNPEVQEDTKQWVDWIGLELNLAGLRLDAVKHMSQAFMKDYIQYIRQRGGRDWLLVGEYAAPDNTKALMEYIRTMNGKMSLFDFPLLRNFIGISRHEDADLRFVFGDTLSEKMSKNSVTFVTNHDTQEREDTGETRIDEEFVPAAYAIILLNRNSGYPCLFWGDLYGVNGPKEPKAAGHGKAIAKLATIRKLYAYGAQNDYLDSKSCIGFTRTGNPKYSNGAGTAVVVSKSIEDEAKRMNVGRQHAGENWTETLTGSSEDVPIDEEGWGVFPIRASRGSGSVAVWVNAAASDRGRLDTNHLAI